MKPIAIKKLIKKLHKLRKRSLVSNFKDFEVKILKLHLNSLSKAIENSHQYFMDELDKYKTTLAEVQEKENKNGD